MKKYPKWELAQEYSMLERGMRRDHNLLEAAFAHLVLDF
jgi:hypothetical protein